MAKSLVIMLANGFEEVEFAMPFDLCYRAGISIELVAVPSEAESLLQVTSSHGLVVKADCMLQDFLQRSEFPDAVFLPGGMPGSKHLADNGNLRTFLQEFARQLTPRAVPQAVHLQKRYLAAICAASAYVLGQSTGILRGKCYTCYPGAESVVPESLQAQKCSEALVEDGHILTADGVASAYLLGERLIQLLVGDGVAEEVMRATLFSS